MRRINFRHQGEILYHLQQKQNVIDMRICYMQYNRFKKGFQLSRITALYIAIATISFCGCNKKTANPVSSSDNSYSPQFLDPKGTVYTGDYFPVHTGLTWGYSGTEAEYLNTHTTIKGPQGVWFDSTEKDTSTMTLSTTRQEQAQQSITIGGNNYTVTPIITRTIITDSDSSDTMDLTGYYGTIDSTVYLRAIIMPSSNGYDTVQTGNSIFIRNPLVVGDTWETAPSSGLGSLGFETGSDVKNLNIHAVTYVLGKDTIAFNGKNIQPLRLDQAFQISCTVSDSESNTIVSSKGVSKLYMIKDTGEIKEVQDQNITMNLTMLLQGDTATSIISTTLSFSENLSSFTTNAMPLQKTILKSTAAPVNSTVKTILPKRQLLTKLQRKALLKATLICKQFAASL